MITLGERSLSIKAPCWSYPASSYLQNYSSQLQVFYCFVYLASEYLLPVPSAI